MSWSAEPIPIFKIFSENIHRPEASRRRISLPMTFAWAGLQGGDRYVSVNTITFSG
jgi:hypothetical protein